MIEPFVHEMGDGRIHVYVHPEQDGTWAVSVLDHRTLYSQGPSAEGLGRVEDALGCGREYARQTDPDHDCWERRCHFGLEAPAPLAMDTAGD